MVQQTTAGIRLRAARLAAGFATVTQLVSGTDVNRTTWRSAEIDHRSIGPKMGNLIADKLEVSPAFISDEKEAYPGDAVAAEIATVLVRAANEDIADVALIASRLKRMRLAKGYDVIRKACAEFGWVVQTYSAHENGRLPIPVDQAISYALAYQQPPGSLLFPAQQTSEDIDNTSWKWLSRSSELNTITILHKSGDRMVMADRVTLPARMLKGRPGVFAVVHDPLNDEEMLLLVRAHSSEPGPVLLSYGEAMSIAYEAPTDADYGDPTLHAAKKERPSVIGQPIGVLRALVD